MMPPIHFRQPENERSEFRGNQNERSAFRRSQNAPHTFQPIIRRLTLAAFLLPTLAFADPRIRTEDYSNQKVYPIYAQVGRAAMVQLADGEFLDTQSSLTGMGDALAWKLAVRGNNIIFKPVEEKPVTNLIVVSNKRTYAFDLKLASNKQPPTYILRFRYPEEIRQARAAKAAKHQAAAQALQQAGGVQAMGDNRNYWGYGDKTLAPTAMWDNGRFTYFRFNNGRTLPVIYRINADGSESLTDSHTEGDTTVVHETAAKFILRSGKSVLGIENRSYNATGTFNRHGTDDGESVRLVK